MRRTGARDSFGAGDYGKSALYDVMVEFDAQPFTDAGLDINSLPDGLFLMAK